MDNLEKCFDNLKKDILEGYKISFKKYPMFLKFFQDFKIYVFGIESLILYEDHIDGLINSIKEKVKDIIIFSYRINLIIELKLVMSSIYKDIHDLIDILEKR